MLGLDNPIHILFLLALLLLVFGAKRLPEMGRSLGTGLRGFKESIIGDEPASTLAVHTVPLVAVVTLAPCRLAAHLEGMRGRLSQLTVSSRSGVSRAASRSALSTPWTAWVVRCPSKPL